MSVRTTADEKLDEARKGITEAILALNEVAVLRCWGHDEFKEEFRKDIDVSLRRLLKV